MHELGHLRLGKHLGTENNWVLEEHLGTRDLVTKYA